MSCVLSFIVNCVLSSIILYDELCALFCNTGTVSAPTVGKVYLKLKAGVFSNVVMPETVESMWGPIPLRRLPAGAVNHCTVANHV